MDHIDDIITEEESGIADAPALGVNALAPTTGSTDQLVYAYSRCEICTSRLHFVYVTDFGRNTTHEKVTCPECGMESRQLLHRLQ